MSANGPVNARRTVFFEIQRRSACALLISTDLTAGNTSGTLFSDTARRLVRAQFLKPTGTSARPFRQQTREVVGTARITGQGVTQRGTSSHKAPAYLRRRQQLAICLPHHQ